MKNKTYCDVWDVLGRLGELPESIRLEFLSLAQQEDEVPPQVKGRLRYVDVDVLSGMCRAAAAGWRPRGKNTLRKNCPLECFLAPCEFAIIRRTGAGYIALEYYKNPEEEDGSISKQFLLRWKPDKECFTLFGADDEFESLGFETLTRLQVLLEQGETLISMCHFPELGIDGFGDSVWRFLANYTLKKGRVAA